MKIERCCAHHPDRAAIGVCVVTGKPMCAECSTRYEGVNYSTEGLERLRRARNASVRAGGARRGLARASILVGVPIAVFLLYLFTRWSILALADIAGTG